MGCTLSFERGDCPEGKTCGVQEDPAERAFTEHALPVLQAACMACHNGATAPEIGFLAGDSPAEIRETILASGVEPGDRIATRRPAAEMIRRAN